MPNADQKNKATLEISPDRSIYCRGDWRLAGLSQVATELKALKTFSKDEYQIHGDEIQTLDSAGAWLLMQLISRIHHAGAEVVMIGFSDGHTEFLDLIQDHIDDVQIQPVLVAKKDIFHRIGVDTIDKCKQGLDMLEFLGEVAISQFRAILHPHRFKWRSMFVAIEEVGFQALPIVALLSFLIGIVLAYQMGLQLRDYGADIFIVNVTGHAVLREFAPLITAIIAAGRTSSSYTAQIGTMKVTEEIDALTTMGLSPIEWLVLPKIIGTLIAIPLLTVWADFFGILGGMFMAKLSLDINYVDFVVRFQDVVPMTTYMIGITKAPVFAGIIALTGCFQGFRVDYNARSVGHRTTISVVQAIFLLIVVDSLFSIYLNWAGI